MIISAFTYCGIPKVPCHEKEIKIDKFKLFGNYVYGDSSYISRAYGIPFKIDNIKGHEYWNYNIRNLQFNFIKKDSVYELNALGLSKLTDDILEINGSFYNSKDIVGDSFLKKMRCRNVAFHNMEDGAIFFLSDKESMRPIFYVDSGRLESIIF